MAVQVIELVLTEGTEQCQIVAEVTKYTNLPNKPTQMSLFGEMTIDYSDIPLDQWKSQRRTLKQNLMRLYQTGYIERSEII